MNKITNNVLLKQIRFNQSKDKAYRKYYVSGAYLDYITREEATQNIPSLIDLKTLELLNNQDKKNLKIKMSNISDKQLIWDFVISLDNTFIHENAIYSSRDFASAIQGPLEKLLEKNKLAMDNLEIFGALHYNTNNLHMHLGFFEKPEQKFKTKGILGGKNMEHFKKFCIDVEKFVVDDKLYKALRSRREFLNEEFKKKAPKDDLYQKVLTYFASKEKPSFQYAKLNEEGKIKINDLVNHLIQSDEELNKKYNEYKKILQKLFEVKVERNNKYHLTNEDELSKWLINQQEDINIRNCNAILKIIKDNFLSNNNNPDIKYQVIDNFKESCNKLVDDVNDALKENMLKRLKKNRSIVSSTGSNKNIKQSLNFLHQISTKPSKNSFNYKGSKKFFIDDYKLKRSIEKAIDFNMSLALKIYKQKEFEFELKQHRREKEYE